MPLITHPSVLIFYRDVDSDVYSPDARIKRGAVNQPHVWHLHSGGRDYDVATMEATANLLRASENDGYPETEPRLIYKIFQGVDYSMSEAWQYRENKKFETGEYLETPWHSAPWYCYSHELHFAHISMTQPGKIAFTQSEAHGERDRQTIISPGKYLLRYFGDWVNQAAVDDYCARIDAATKILNTPLLLAKTSKDIVSVYQNGPSSCMSKEADHDDYRTGGVHPVSVYGAGDLAVAYYKAENGTIKARCLVWPEKKIYGRVYGDNARLRMLLARDGYANAYGANNNHLWDGARLLKVRVPDGDGYVCPYLDVGSQHVNIGEKYLVIHHDGDHCADNVTAVIDGEGTGDNRPEYVCDNCNAGLDDDGTYSVNGEGCLCHSCYSENYTQCDNCDHDVSNDDSNTVYNRRGLSMTYCEDCTNEHTVCCQHCEHYVIIASRRRSSNISEMVKSIYSNEDGDCAGYCPQCVENEYVEQRPCGHYAEPSDHETCFCGAPHPVTFVKTTIREHKVTA